jgi:transposase
MSRETVKKHLESGETEAKYTRQKQPYPRLGEFLPTLEELLKENEGRGRRDRLDHKKLFQALVVQGYRGGYDAVRRYAKRWQEEHRRGGGVADAFVPLIFAPGEAYQFDWSEEQVVLNGVSTKVQVAHMRLSHSRMPFVRAYPRQTQEMLFDAHARAFRFFGGACTRGIYDNMKTAVDAVFVGKERKFNRRFSQMCSHFLVEPSACSPAAGWEKGQVENQVGTMRTTLFTPRRKVASLEDLNNRLKEECVTWAQSRPHPEQPGKTIWDVFEAERPLLVPVSTAFDGFREVSTSASRQCLVRFDRNKYSVDAKAAGKAVQLRAYAEKIVIRLDGEIVATHARRFGRDRTVYEPLHYIPILARKPGALRNGAPFREWKMPEGLNKVRNRLGRTDDADRQFARILAAIPDAGLEAVDEACRQALHHGVCSQDMVLSFLYRQDNAPAVEVIQTPAALELAVPPEANCARYDSLCAVAGGRHGTR